MSADAEASIAPDTGEQTLAGRAKRGVLWLGIVNIASKGTQMAVMLAVAAFLTESELGLVTVAVSLVNIAAVVQMMAVYEVIACAKSDEKVMADTTVTISLAASVVLCMSGVLGAGWIAGALGSPSASGLIALVALSLPFTAVGGVQMALIHRALDFRLRLLPDAGSAVLGAVVAIVLASTGAGSMSLAIGLLVSAVLQPLFGFLVGVRVRPGWDRAAATEAFRWMATLGPGAIIAIVVVNVDYAIILRMLGPDAVGVYSLAFRIAWSPYVMIALVLNSVAFPVYAALLRDNRRRDIPATANRFTGMVLLTVGGIYLIIALMAGRVELLGARWAPAAPVLMVLCLYGLGLSLLQAWYDLVNVVGRTGYYLGFEIVRLVLLVSGLLILTEHGVTVAAFAQVVAVWAVMPFVWVTIVRAKLAPPKAQLVRTLAGFAVPAMACVGAYLALRLAGLEHSMKSWGGAVLELAVLLTCYVGVAALLNRDVVESLRGLRSAKAVPA
jgi:O-antigen/teichoic acid export membrane protein